MKVRSDILRVYSTLHTWVGICAGLLLFIGFVGGALTMFKQPLDNWSRGAEKQWRALSMAEIDLLVEQVVDSRADARSEFLLHVPVAPADSSPLVSAPVVWGGGSEGPTLDLTSPQYRASLDKSGALEVSTAVPTQLGNLIDELHRTGGIPGIVADEYIGGYIMGLAGVLYFLALVSGLVILLPTLIKDFFALRTGKNRKRFWLDAHNVIGIASLPFHLLISFTVIVFAFHDQFYGLLETLVYTVAEPFSGPDAAATPYPLTELLAPSVLIEKLGAAAPGFVVTELLFMNLDTTFPMVRAAIVSAAHVVHGPVSGYVGIHPFTGEITNTSLLPGQGTAWSEIVSSFFALHFGSFGGTPVRWMYFLLGLSGAFLFYSGNLLWVESRRKHQKRLPQPVKQPRHIGWLASLTVGICWGSVAGIALAMSAGKWFYAVSDTRNEIYLLTYYSVFVLATAWAFWRGVARAVTELLGLCALACLLIPVTSLLAYLVPAAGLWTGPGLPPLGVDLVALALGLGFYRAARLSYKRACHGPADSVWSIHAGYSA